MTGITFYGELAGKTAYLLPSPVNNHHCWQDSVFWSGSELLYGITALSITGALTGMVAADPDCVLPAGHLGPSIDFNLYSATASNGAWTLTNLALNNANYALSSPKQSGTTFAAVNFSTGKANGGDIYLVQRTGSNSFGVPVAFSQNSTNCGDDNPTLLDNGTRIIFESNQTGDSVSSSCTPNAQKLWTSSLTGGAWSTPVAIGGAPTIGGQAEQPWVNEADGTLYWTGDTSACGGGVTNCIFSAAGDGVSWPGAATKIATPTPFGDGAGGNVVLLGQYSKAAGFAVMACALATDTDPTGMTPSLYLGRWTVYVNICAVPLN